ncbi:type II secretion system protein, partial [Candidatus Peregrinibacteria bacterium]|nr:type II secretion system protein [Candidatus Peregrinibacteria bacterium]
MIPLFAKKPGGFTLIELIISIGMFAFITAILMRNLFLVYHFKEAIRYKKDINFEASSVLSGAVAGLVRSGFSINYEKTEAGKSGSLEKLQENEEIEGGMRTEVDSLSVYTDRLDRQYFTLYREPYVADGDTGDTARLMIEFGNGEKYPLHSSETVVEDFDVKVPEKPAANAGFDVQPYVDIYLRVRHRDPLSETPDEET